MNAYVCGVGCVVCVCVWCVVCVCVVWVWCVWCVYECVCGVRKSVRVYEYVCMSVNACVCVAWGVWCVCVCVCVHVCGGGNGCGSELLGVTSNK